MKQHYSYFNRRNPVVVLISKLMWFYSVETKQKSRCVFNIQTDVFLFSGNKTKIPLRF
jgi:hypothetical protein